MASKDTAPTDTAARIAAAVRAGELTARTAVERSLARIAALDDAVNAFSVVRGPEALAEADALDAGGPGSGGPLAGVPVAVKEEYDVAGLVTTLGGRANSTPARNDDEVVRRLRAAGAVIVGKTTMPEFGQFPMSESPATGITRNPWDLTRTTGGSSAGSAGAVAAGMVPVGMAADGGGSIRIPAAACGLVGLKPQRGRITTDPLPDRWFGLATFGVLTRTAEDTALVLDVVAGNVAGDRWRARPPARSFREEIAEEPQGLRITWARNNVLPGLPTDPQVAAALSRFAGRLAALGHEVRHERVAWPVPTTGFLPRFFAGLREEAGQVEHPDRLSGWTRSNVRASGWARGPVVRLATREGDRVARALERLFEGADLLLLPTNPALPHAVEAFTGVSTMTALLRSTRIVANMVLANVSGHPAISLPAGLSREGWPIGAQLIAPLGQEGRLLALAAALERRSPWPTPPETGR